MKDRDIVTTPEWVTRFLLDREVFVGNVLEPCCGNGDISKVLKERNYNVLSSDIRDTGYGDVVDLFSLDKEYDNIITNPPFSIASKVKRHLLSITKNKLALLWFVKGLGNEVETKEVKHLKDVYILGKVDFPEVKFGWKFAWYVWDKNYTGEVRVYKPIDSPTQESSTKEKI
jgi:hypothetical protein